MNVNIEIIDQLIHLNPGSLNNTLSLCDLITLCVMKLCMEAVYLVQTHLRVDRHRLKTFIILAYAYLHVVKVLNGHWSQMADGHLGLGSNVQLDLVDFKVLCSANRDWF